MTATGLPASDAYTIRARSSPADERTRVLKHDDTFAVFDRFGDVTPGGLGEQGLYHDGTRHLSTYRLLLFGERPLLLSSTVLENNSMLAVDLANLDTYAGEDLVIPRDTVHLLRRSFLWGPAYHERLAIANYGEKAVHLALAVQFESDFVDIFEVRGMIRDRRGKILTPSTGAAGVVLAYRGLDEVERRTRLLFSPPPGTLTGAEARFSLQVPAGEQREIEVTVVCEAGQDARSPAGYDASASALEADWHRHEGDYPVITTSNEQFNELLTQSFADLRMMLTRTPSGPFPFAGVPWFNTQFGRDALVTALETLWLNPRIAEGVLRYLALTQATEDDPSRDAEPGKILHEARRGEMANLREVPFGRYYGSVDATPLFVLLAGRYEARTGDRRLVEDLWPSIDRALSWLETSADSDGDGFVDYHRRSPAGLIQQGWKDSADSIFYEDGTVLEGEVALCEVQGYAYAARMEGSWLAAQLNERDRAQRLRADAVRLQERYESAFWCEDLGTYALALGDGGRPCRVLASNAGHALFSGIARPERAKLVAATLMADESFSGWGIRTLAHGEARYNPISYHNGSVWPHDNALIAAGLARYGMKDAVLRILGAVFDASTFLDLHRLPELYCGFERRPRQGPTQYPVACSPQTWAAASVFLLLQSALGLAIDAREPRITFRSPQLPSWLAEVELHGLRAGEHTVDVALERREDDVAVHILRRRGPVEVVVVK